MTKQEMKDIINEFSDDCKKPKWYMPTEFLNKLKIVLQQYVKKTYRRN